MSEPRAPPSLKSISQESITILIHLPQTTVNFNPWTTPPAPTAHAYGYNNMAESAAQVRLYTYPLSILSLYEVSSFIQLFSRLGAKELLGDLDLPIFSQLTPEAHGLKPGDVIEFTGAEGTGKSEILLNIAVQCSLPKTWQGRKLGGREGEVLYISTDYKFDVFRLMTILEGRVLNEALHTEAIDETTPQGVPHSKSEYKELISSSLARVHVAYCCSSSELAVSLQSLKTFLHNHPKVCVLMLDNVAAYYWTDRGKTAVVEGNEHQWITSLNELKQEYHLIVFAAKPLLLNKPIMIMSKQKGEYDGKVSTQYSC